MPFFEDPATGLRLVVWGGWLLVAVGICKLLVYTVGEAAPGCYARVRSEPLRKFLTGTGNRLLFGLGGCLTALLGIGFVVIAVLCLRLVAAGL